MFLDSFLLSQIVALQTLWSLIAQIQRPSKSNKYIVYFSLKNENIGQEFIKSYLRELPKVLVILYMDSLSTKVNFCMYSSIESGFFFCKTLNEILELTWEGLNLSKILKTSKNKILLSIQLSVHISRIKRTFRSSANTVMISTRFCCTAPYSSSVFDAAIKLLSPFNALITKNESTNSCWTLKLAFSLYK